MFKQLKAFTFIELLIVVSITALLTTFGYSAYRKTEEKQQLIIASEQIINTFYTVQKKASVGEYDCSGSFMGYQLNFNSNGTMTYRGLCSGSNMPSETVNISNLTEFNPNTSITFRPLTGNLEMSSSPITIQFTTSSSNTGSIIISKPANIRYQQP